MFVVNILVNEKKNKIDDFFYIFPMQEVLFIKPIRSIGHLVYEEVWSCIG